LTSTRPTKEFVLAEIRRLVAAEPERSLGRTRFARETGIKQSVWEGRYWPTWSDALKEAGAAPNTMNQPLDEDDLLRQLAEFTRELGRVPSAQHLRMRSRSRPDFSSDKTYFSRFDSAAGMADALRAWVTERGEYADVATLLGDPAKGAGSKPAASDEGGARSDLILSDSFVPPVVAGLPSLARMETALPIEFEKRVASAFEMLGLEVQRLGQGSGREPDGIARCRQHGWVLIYDAKARAGMFRMLAPEERKFREYIVANTENLRREGMTRSYFVIVSSAFSESDLAKARELSKTTEAKAIALVEAEALVKLVQQRIKSPLDFTYQHLERAFSDTRIVKARDIGDGEPLRFDVAPAPHPLGSEGTIHDRDANEAFDKLMVRWPDFEAKVKMFAEFFDYSLIYCLATPLQSSDGLDPTKPEDAALDGRRAATLSALGLLNSLAYDIVKELRSRPPSIEAARGMVDRFRKLLAAPAMLALEELYAALSARSRRTVEFTSRMERLRAFKHDYESFARSANQHIGNEFFRPYIP
jgi:hypothetical protein